MGKLGLKNAFMSKTFSPSLFYIAVNMIFNYGYRITILMYTYKRIGDTNGVPVIRHGYHY